VTTPTPGPQDPTPRPGGCTLSETNWRTGETTVRHLPEPLQVLVQLADGTRLPVEEYLADREAYDRQAGDGPSPRRGDAAGPDSDPA
jgi:hypothetical protein